ncbi:hypothetical protein Y1Q_0023147 [Alligator mississippiensis]|uniref:Uncharacterized protein n=1 Tax=Alligator mississippiensis TaxID=8496 RepID=A0A151MZD5_ALLMI|nr:hypothetical protein Y1Q_0023147 [Alligator mississippiensis]
MFSEFSSWRPEKSKTNKKTNDLLGLKNRKSRQSLLKMMPKISFQKTSEDWNIRRCWQQTDYISFKNVPSCYEL